MTNYDDEREGACSDPWLEAVNRALWHYDTGLLDVRGVADTLASQHPEPEITDEMVERAEYVVCGEDYPWIELEEGVMRAALEAALRVPVSDALSGEGEHER